MYCNWANPDHTAHEGNASAWKYTTCIMPRFKSESLFSKTWHEKQDDHITVCNIQSACMRPKAALQHVHSVYMKWISSVSSVMYNITFKNSAKAEKSLTPGCFTNCKQYKCCMLINTNFYWVIRNSSESVGEVWKKRSQRWFLWIIHTLLFLIKCMNVSDCEQETVGYAKIFATYLFFPLHLQDTYTEQ